MELNEALGRALKELRTDRGISQEKVGASQSYVSDVERGLKSISIEKLDEFASVIGVHPATILLRGYVLMAEADVKEQLLARVGSELRDADRSYGGGTWPDSLL